MCATKVEGEKNDHNVMLYTLSTCTWCQATKDFLEENGFYVAERSNTNYIWTPLSLSSSLNMDYVQDLGLDLRESSFPAIFVEPIHHNRVRSLLEGLGYTSVALRSGYIPTEIVDADIFLQPSSYILEKLRKPLTLNGFEGILLNSTAFRVIGDFEQYFDLHLLDITGQREYQQIGLRISQHSNDVFREIILTQFDDLKSVPEMPGPKFVFAHIVSPHSPYLFGPSGERIDQEDPFTLATTDPPSQTEIKKYRDQAIYITNRVEEVVQEILENSLRPPIIILQADHGPGLTPGWNQMDGEGLWHRTAILNAFNFPDGCDQFLYPSITPVNSFRIIFNCYFGTDYPLIEDNVYFGYSPNPYAEYKFVLINDRIH